MKKDIHPKYFPKAKIVCSCGKTHEVGSIKEKVEVEICSACHPFFTGQEKLIDTAGRVEKFKARRTKAEEHKTAKKAKKPAKKVPATKKVVSKKKVAKKTTPPRTKATK